jgi:hypothetical protein
VIGLDAVEIFRLPVLDGLKVRIIPLQLPKRFAVTGFLSVFEVPFCAIS